MDKEQARKFYEMADRLSKLDVSTLSEQQLAERDAMIARLQEVKQRLDPKCWKGKHKEGTKIKGGVRVNNCVPNESIEEAGSPAQQAAIAINMKKHHKKPMGEADGEYDDEAGMAQGSLKTMSRAVNGLMDTIQQGDNLPEWAQEKLSLAEDYLTTVWDYLLSQKEQGVEPKIAEAKKPSPKLTAVEMKKVDPVSEEINTEAYERLQKVFAFKNYES